MAMNYVGPANRQIAELIGAELFLRTEDSKTLAASIVNADTEVLFQAAEYTDETNAVQDGRLTTLENMQPVKAVRLEAGKWVWDVDNATHYLFPAPSGGLGVHATAWPVPSKTTPTLNW
jgi:hypothetical protein